MDRRTAIDLLNKDFGGFAEAKRVPNPNGKYGTNRFLFIVGRRGSDNLFHPYGSGRSYDEAVMKARLRLHKMKAQMELELC